MRDILSQYSISTDSPGLAMNDINELSDPVVLQALSDLGVYVEDEDEASTALKHAAVAIIKGEDDIQAYVDSKLETVRDSGISSGKTRTRPAPGLSAFAPKMPTADPADFTPFTPSSEETVSEETVSEETVSEENNSGEVEVTVEPASTPAASVKRRGRSKSAETAYDRAAVVMQEILDNGGKGTPVKEVLSAILAKHPSMAEASARVYISQFNAKNDKPFVNSGKGGRRSSGSQTGYQKAVAVIEAAATDAPGLTRAELVERIAREAHILPASANVYVSMYRKAQQEAA